MTRQASGTYARSYLHRNLQFITFHKCFLTVFRSDTLFCKRWSFSLSKVTFQAPKDHLLQGEMPCFKTVTYCFRNSMAQP